METSNLSKEAEQLILAVDIALSPNASHEDRSQAYIFCENFKEESPLCATIGFELAAVTLSSSAAKRFGLQLIEHYIKFRWNIISSQEKLYIKVGLYINLFSLNYIRFLS